MLSDLKRFFSLNLNEYENIGIDFPIGIFCSLLCLAFCISLFVIYFRKRILSDVAVALVRHEAFDASLAKTLKQLKIDTPAVRYEIRRNRRLAAMVSVAGKEDISYDDYLSLTKSEQKKYDKIDFDTALFYLNKEGIESAKIISEKDGTSIFSPIFISLFSIAVLFLLSQFLPDLLLLIK